MKKLLFIISIFFTFLCLSSNLYGQASLVDVVYLKDGSIIKGQIIEQIPNVSIKIRTEAGNVFVYKIENIEKMVKEESKFKATEIKQVKNPTTAFLLSFLIPGLGQYYNGETGKGIAIDVAYIGGIVLALTAGIRTYEDEYNYGGYYYYENRTEITAFYWIGFGVSFCAGLYSMIDAPSSANRINRELSQPKWGHLIEFNNDKYALGFDVVPQKQGVGTKLTLHFWYVRI